MVSCQIVGVTFQENHRVKINEQKWRYIHSVIIEVTNIKPQGEQHFTKHTSCVPRGEEWNEIIWLINLGTVYKKNQ